MIDQITSPEDPVSAFSYMITEIQYLEAYPAKQRFIKDKEGVLFGMYTLTETILPFKPFVEYASMNIVEPKSVKYWLLNLITIDGDESDPNSYKVLKIVKYDDFMNTLPADRYQFIDGAYVVIDERDKEFLKDRADRISKCFCPRGE